MKTLIDISRKTWAFVKYYATIKEMTLNTAVTQLLEQSLDHFGLDIDKGGSRLE
jgi:hypothetical protein